MTEYINQAVQWAIESEIMSNEKVLLAPYSHWPLLVFLILVAIIYNVKITREIVNESINKIVGNGISSTYIAIVTLVFGALFSVFSTELKTEIQGGIGITVILSLIGLVCLFFILNRNDFVIQKDLREKESKLDRQINNLKVHLSNMPPKTVLSNISQHVIALNELVIQEGISAEDKVKEILSSIVELAALWDGHETPKDVDYNINFMLLLESQAVKAAILEGSTDFKDAIIKSAFFLYSDNLDSCLDNCDAILYTKREYSVSTNGGKSENDSEPCMCLPVTLNRSDLKNKQPNIFGAPACVVDKKATYIPNTSEALQSFINEAQSSHSRFSKYYQNSLEKYYNDCKYSIYSIPLQDKDGVIFAVVNIYQSFIGCDNKLILRSEEHASSFYHLMTPICNLLAQVLDLGSRAESSTEQEVEECTAGAGEDS
ncbi:TPA: hypothetical protein ACPVWX_004687 [Vibrio parahaemolyticus]